MTRWNHTLSPFAAALLAFLAACCFSLPSMAQDQAAADTSAAAAEAPDPLDEDELEVLVARIALYPDELVAVISEASLYPLQIVEAARFLDKAAKDKDLKPKDSWDGSVISLLNYPEVVTMMSDDLEWTQTLGDALTYQQKDVLIAIQQLRDKAVAAGAIKTDDKIKVEQSGDNVVIQSVNPEVVYVPQYEPQMLYAPDYQMAPVSYYPDPYPSYWYPTATYFAGAVTGAIFAAAVDWDDWGVWGGRWNGGDIDVDCNNCFNNRDFNGKVNFNDIDWKNVDRSKLNFDKDKLKNIDRSEMRNRVKADGRNDFRNRASEIRKERPTAKTRRDETGVRCPQKQHRKGLEGQAGGAGRINRDFNRPAGGRRGSTGPTGPRLAKSTARSARSGQRPGSTTGRASPRGSEIRGPANAKRLRHDAVARAWAGESRRGRVSRRRRWTSITAGGGGGHARRGGGGGRRR